MSFNAVSVWSQTAHLWLSGRCNSARCMGPPERAMRIASNRVHRRVYEHIAAHDPRSVAV
ncbi:hypothetical protein PV726_43605 [Streptomyces europaeiscabiei]|uniref:hypothetical protein n=1 Tax=Streptomyces europaeiscabiei TaxID=146819 RepID=UPI0029B67FF0|nr:hypothetical protein [Streptomyces europaeiscabiei]MDX3697009.1 hypothetical protein [Streptomyces europaeiscabiei]